ncbi:MAG: hypothetical protein ABIH03_14180 [Pseudomonadota bacterium]
MERTPSHFKSLPLIIIMSFATAAGALNPPGRHSSRERFLV